MQRWPPGRPGGLFCVRGVLSPGGSATTDRKPVLLAVPEANRPDPVPPRDLAPDWAAGASQATSFRHGLASAFSVPGLILLATSAGFGALARDGGVSLLNTVFMMAAFFALPAQVVLTDQIARGASLAAGALAVTLTGIRLLPMTVALTPYLRGRHATRWHYLLAVHFIAVTAWLEGWRRLPSLPADLRMAHFLGIGTGLLSATLVGSALGYELAGTVPKLVAAALLFLTPIYFLLSLIAASAGRTDRLAIACGVALGPPFYLLAPGLDLLATGLVGGSLAYWMGRRGRT